MSRNQTYRKLINSKEWKSLRTRKLSDSPLCEVCERNGKSELAVEVHHRVPVESDNTESGMRRLMFDYSNLMGVCHACHSDIHREMFSHTKESVKVSKKRETKRFIDKFL